jgi:hypothetical protein
LDSLARRDGVDIRPTLIRVLTDLYVQKPAHTSEEERDYTELVLRLVDSVDLATRVTVARKIASYAAAPPAVARRLARDAIEVAEPVLRHCAALNSDDLDAIASDFGAGHAAAVAARRETAEPVMPRRIAEAVAVKPARLDEGRSAGNPEIGIAELFFSADSAARRILLATLGSIENETPQSVQPVETIRALESAALGRDPVGFTRLIEGALGLSQAQAERIVADQSGEPLLVAAKALAMPSAVLQRVLMFIDPAIGESVDRFFDLAGLYERLSADAAHKIIESVRGREPVRARRPAHRAMYYDDEAARSRRGAAPRRLGVSAEPQAPARTETGKTQRTM